MREGAFALIDCLGFKGIWKRMENEDPQPLLKKLRQIQTTVNELIRQKSGLFSFTADFPIKTVVRLLSDTVAISFTINKKEPEEKRADLACFSVAIMAYCVIKILSLFIEDEPHLVMRGCITFGKHTSTGNFIAGPAVDEAAEHMNLPEGAFIWLLPKAAQRFEKHKSVVLDEIATKYAKTKYAKNKLRMDNFNDVLPSAVIITDYPMSIKGGGELLSSTVNPFIFCKNDEEAEKMFLAYSKAMSGDRLDIWLKKQNTMKFLELARTKFKTYKEINDKYLKL